MDDPVMVKISEAMISGGRDRAGAREKMDELWASICAGGGDALHRCTLAHYAADLQDSAAAALEWDLRAFEAFEDLTDERVQQHHSSLNVGGFLPSLHLNLADDYRRLGDTVQANEHLEHARAHVGAIGDDPYGTGVLAGIDHVAEALAAGSTEPISPGGSPR